MSIRGYKVIDRRKIEREIIEAALDAAMARIGPSKKPATFKAQPMHEEHARESRISRKKLKPETAKKLLWKIVGRAVDNFITDPKLLMLMPILGVHTAGDVAEAFGGASQAREIAAVGVDWNFQQRRFPYTVAQYSAVYRRVCECLRFPEN